MLSHPLLWVLQTDQTKQLNASHAISKVQFRFSEFTSGWKLCNELRDLLNCSLNVSQEFVIDSKWTGVLTPLQPPPEANLAFSLSTSRSVASSKFSAATATARFEQKREHYRAAIADTIQEEGNSEPFRLKTLEEHRFATRFQEKKVTPKTWRKALREANQLVRLGDRVKLADALYILLEIIYLDPRGCNLASMYLNAGSIYLEFDHLQEAAKAYRNCLRLDPASWKARYNLGVAAARLQDFVEATKQLTLALEACPADVAEEIPGMLEEIDRISCSRNLRAFRETRKPRAFTTQYLESLGHVSPKGKMRVSDSFALPEDHTQSHHNGRQMIAAAPQVIDFSCEWRGALASLLHRIHIFAWYRHLNIQDEIRQCNPSERSHISVESLNKVVLRITGGPLRIVERNEFTRVFGDEVTALFHVLAPNPSTARAFNDVQPYGVSHATLEWSLFCKRSLRSANSRTGGLWYWFDLTLAKWIEQVIPVSLQTHANNQLLSQVTEILKEGGWHTPMDFAWARKQVPVPEAFSVLKLADRGVLIYECHRARTAIREEASRTLQMFARRLGVHAKLRKKVLDAYRHHKRRSYEQFKSENIHERLVADTTIDQQVMHSVLLCMEDIIDELVENLRLERKSYEDAVRWQEVPVRTEQRQKIISAVGIVQNVVREATAI